MINTDAFDIFRKLCTPVIYSEHNSYDMMVYPNIPDAKKGSARNNFSIGLQEEILLIRDTGTWNQCDQGLVLTDVGVYVIPDNEKDDRYAITWLSIERVEYQDMCIYLYNYQGDSLPIHMSFFVKTSDESNCVTLGRKIAPVFDEMAKSVNTSNDPAFLAYLEVLDLNDGKKYNEALNLACQHMNKFPKDQCLFHLAQSETYNLMKDYSSSLNEGVKAMDLSEYGSPVHAIAAGIISEYYSQNSDFKKARNLLWEAIKYADFDEEYRKRTQIEFKTNEEQFVNTFFSQPYSERKIVAFVKSYSELNQENISVVSLDNDISKFSLPLGHPIANELYVGHPLIPNKYIPFESYQRELVEDRVREFCQLVQSLGATEIEIECLNSSKSDSSYNGSSDEKGKINSVSGAYNKNYSRRLIDELSNSICLHQTFKPTHKPYVPNNLVWYNNEPSWQRLASQRLNGGLTSHEERIETKKSQMIEGRELSAIKGEWENLFASMGIAYQNSDDYKFQLQDNTTLSIKVAFDATPVVQGQVVVPSPIEKVQTNQPMKTAMDKESTYYDIIHNHKVGFDKFATKEELPLLSEHNYEILPSAVLLDIIVSNYDKILAFEKPFVEPVPSESSVSQQNTNLEDKVSAESEYLDELRECLNNGEVGSGERRLLEKLRMRLGISESRAKELEDSLSTPSLSKVEEEYLDELKECLASGTISDGERRLLDKIRIKLGISEARARELEESLSEPKLTDDELEYLNEYKECLASGSMSESERRLLDRFRSKLGISEERAKEIEKMA